jgi:hypothetical protein
MLAVAYGRETCLRGKDDGTPPPLDLSHDPIDVSQPEVGAELLIPETPTRKLYPISELGQRFFAAVDRTPQTLRSKKRTLPTAGASGGGAVRRLFAGLDAELATTRLTDPKMLQLVYPELPIPQQVLQLNYIGSRLVGVSFEPWGVCDYSGS